MSKKVVHLGPTNSIGGMSVMINNLVMNTPDNYSSNTINSHTDGNLLLKLFKWRQAKSKLKMLIKEKKIDILHVHVTHSMSWWRKINISRVCKNRIPVIFHIHSGRFDEFCASGFGMCGFMVRRTLKKNNIKVILLEKRWLKLLENWIPNRPYVISNFSMTRNHEIRDFNNVKLKILMLSRKSKGKRHDFALEIARELLNKGFDFEMKITGIENISVPEDLRGTVIAKGWVTESEKYRLINDAHVMIMPSDFEGSSMTVIESITNGLPCFVSETSSETIGIQELVIPMNNAIEWSEKIISICDKGIYGNLQKKVIERSSFFDKDTNRQKLSDLYDSMI